MDQSRIALFNDDITPPGQGDWPFQKPYMNDGYALFCERASRRGIPVMLANDQDYREGHALRGWIHDGERYHGVGPTPLSGIYDQFQSGTPRGRWMTGDLLSRGIPVLNDPKATLVVDDKLLTFMNFPEISPFTYYFRAGEDDPRIALERFLEGCRDHGHGEIEAMVAKEQTGWGARNLYRFVQENLTDLYHIPPGEYVLQPFLESACGIPELGVQGRHDFRIILENGRFVTGMVRQPARHDWAANYYNSDELIFVEREEDVPSDLLGAARLADSRMEEFYPRMISYDLARVEDGRVICWEMNSRPGMCSDSEREDDHRSSEAMHEAILNCFEIILERD